MIELLVFETAPETVRSLADAGFSSFIVDLERLGKDLRQLGFNTEINANTAEDISTLRDLGIRRIWTRVNAFGPHTEGEIHVAIQNGAACIVLPMVRATEEVESVLRYIDGRAELCVMIETPEAVKIATQLNRMPISSAYFGLNDYAIGTGNRNIFAPIAEGVVDRVRASLDRKKFGFGGLTHPESGFPLPSIGILLELERLECSFTFLRRSFKRDLSQYGPRAICARLAAEWRNAQQRTDTQRKEDHDELSRKISSLANLSLI